MKTNPLQSESFNLFYRNAEINDIPKLQQICDSWTDKLLVEGEEFEPNYIANCIKNGDLPPIENAKVENYSIKAICHKKDNEIIGFFDIYQGYPSNDVLWISMFVIDRAFQKSGFGSEIIDLLSQNAKENGFKALGIGVHLKNHKAQLFWVKNRFDKILEFQYDIKFNVDTSPVIKMMKII